MIRRYRFGRLPPDSSSLNIAGNQAMYALSRGRPMAVILPQQALTRLYKYGRLLQDVLFIYMMDTKTVYIQSHGHQMANA